MAIRYSAGYKYQLRAQYQVLTPITGVSIYDDYFRLNTNGLLTAFKGYAWDGASGWTFDTKSSMTPSLVHDIFCQCMRDDRLSYSAWQGLVNDFFRQQLVISGVWGWRAMCWRVAVSIGDAGNPNQGPDRLIMDAP